jgi:hypothetical protein
MAQYGVRWRPMGFSGGVYEVYDVVTHKTPVSEMI